MSYYQGTSAGVDAPTCDSGEVVSSLPVPERLIAYEPKKMLRISTIRGAVGLVPTGEFTPRQTSKVLIFTQDQVQLYRTPPATSTRRTGSNGQLSG